MKVVILGGGRGTRLAEETVVRPKPLVEIGGKPILWHIMNVYASYGHKDFLVASGYKGEMIKDYFDAGSPDCAEWQVGVIDTGLDTQTGGRILRLRKEIGDETFMVTYGDGVADVDIRALVEFHKAHGRLATVTAVHPPARFGSLNLDGDDVREFSEKPQSGEGWINGGFFVFEAGVFDYLAGDETILERDPLERLAAEKQLRAFRHSGFWQPMDTLREKQLLDSMWKNDEAAWKVW